MRRLPQLLGRPHSLVSCRVACREVGARPTLAQDCTVWHCSAAVAAERRVELYQQLTDGGAHHTSSHPGPPLHQWPASKNDMFTHTPFLRSWMVETHFYTNRSSFHWWATPNAMVYVKMLLLRSVKCTGRVFNERFYISDELQLYLFLTR